MKIIFAILVLISLGTISSNILDIKDNMKINKLNGEIVVILKDNKNYTFSKGKMYIKEKVISCESSELTKDFLLEEIKEIHIR